MSQPGTRKPSAKLPPMDFDFDIQITGAETGELFIGHFKYRRPSLGTRSRITAMRARMNGDLTTLDEDTQDFNHAISWLRFTLDDYPQWWSDASYGMDLHDANVVAEIYNRCMDFETKWKERVFSGDPKKVNEGDPANAVKEAFVDPK